MDEKHLLETTGIDADDWEKTPVSVRQIVVRLGLKIEQLEQQLKELQDSSIGTRRESQSKLRELP
jgi:transposase